MTKDSYLQNGKTGKNLLFFTQNADTIPPLGPSPEELHPRLECRSRWWCAHAGGEGRVATPGAIGGHAKGCKHSGWNPWGPTRLCCLGQQLESPPRHRHSAARPLGKPESWLWWDALKILCPGGKRRTVAVPEAQLPQPQAPSSPPFPRLSTVGDRFCCLGWLSLPAHLSLSP